jgi:hypothetical protein
MGDNHNNAKIVWSLLKIFFSRTTGPILTRLGQVILGRRD